MSELPDHVPPAKEPEPKPSALGIVLRRGADGSWEALLGRRSARTRFMPRHAAFPGGRLEAEDGAGDFDAFRRCVAREILEETGLAIPESSWHDAGERTTPPMFPIRYRTWFFVAELPEGAALPASPPQPEEVDHLFFSGAAQVLDDWNRGKELVPPPLLPILRVLAASPSDTAAQFAARVRAFNTEEDELPRIEFVPGTWVLPVRTATLPPATHTNVWMPGGSRFVLVDPGSSDPTEIDRLARLVRRRIAEGSTPEAIVLTHQHRDHVAGARTLAQRLDLPVRAHPETLALAAAALDGARTEAIGDGALLDLGGMTLRVLHTPGHAPGHIALHDAERKTVIAGDLVSGFSTILIGGLDGGDMDAYLASLERVAALGCRSLLPAHGPPLPGTAIVQAFAHRREREDRIMDALIAGSPVALTDIARAAYADTPDAPPLLASMQTRAHLESMERRGAVRRDDAGGAAWRRVSP